MPLRTAAAFSAALSALVFLSAYLGAPASARAADAPPSRAATLAKVEAYMNGLTTLQSEFVQLSSNGLFAEGVVAISRPGKLRMDYAPPVPVQLISNGVFLAHVDTELNQVNNIPLIFTPAYLLLSKTLSFADPEITVTGFERKDGVIAVTVAQADDPEEGSLTLIFTESPMQLRKWRVVDAEGITTDVTLLDPRTGMQLDDNMFIPPMSEIGTGNDR